ncbi:hypothetical protein [Mesorhizobium sp. CAU 1732]|uniref:hypothetical protein n=1 Tax=Mesorhizobium sp. CAU 1732 TaxID=3140358 RepID=UPI003261D04F
MENIHAFMEKSSARELTWLAPWGAAVAAAGFVGWVCHLTLPTTVHLSSAIASIIISLALLAYIGTTLHIMATQHVLTPSKPRILLYKQEERGIFLTSPSDWLSYQSAYSMFLVEADGFERLLCIAEVLIIQDDKKVQLAIAKRNDSAADVWDSLQRGSTDHFKQIIIKPGVPMNWTVST